MATSSPAEPSSAQQQQEEEEEFITEPYIPEKWSLMSTFGVLLLFFTITIFIILTVLSKRRRRHLIRLEREREVSASSTSHGTKSLMTCTPPATIEIMEPTVSIQECEMPPPSLQQAIMAAFPSDEDEDTATYFPSDEGTYRSDGCPSPDEENPPNAEDVYSTDATDKAKTILSGRMSNLEQCATGEEVVEDTSMHSEGFEMYFF